MIHFYPRRGTGELEGEDNLTTYSWGRKFAGHRFCKICGVQVDIELYGPPKEILDKLSAERLAKVQELVSIHPINLRVLDDVEWAGRIG